MWLVTSVCLYIYMSLVYERFLKNVFGVLESPGNFSEQKSGNPDSGLDQQYGKV